MPTTPNWMTEGNQVGAGHGGGLANAGDLNGDGYEDIVVGAAGYDNGEFNEGRVYVYYGSATGLPATPDWTYESNNAESYTGQYLGHVGDVNGDGYDDLAVGAYMYTNPTFREGIAMVFHGGPGGLGSTPDWSVEGESYEALFGTLCTGGDFNGDGYDDVLVSALRYSGSYTREGAVFLYQGSASGLSTTPAWTQKGNAAYRYLGEGYNAGDVNGDGYDDVAIRDPHYSNGQSIEGRILVYYGSSSGPSATPSWQFETNQAGIYAGIPVVQPGDVNGDGYDDLCVTMPQWTTSLSHQGRFVVFHGRASGLPSTPDLAVDGDQADANMGYFSALGDVNGDGYSDLLIPEHRWDNPEVDEGKALLYLGSASGLAPTPVWSAEINQATAYFGYYENALSDVNGDGYDDAIVGAQAYDNGEADEGAAFAFYSIPPASVVYVDDGYTSGGYNDGHTWGYDAFATIQAGINAVSGSIVNVAAGTYAERLLVSKSVELRGPQYGVDPTLAGARTVTANEAVIDITGLPLTNPNVAVEIPAGVTDVVMDGFTIKGSPTFHYADEAAIRAWDDNITISNNIVVGYRFDAYIGVLYKGNDHFTASRNRMTVNKNGVVVQPNAATDVTISGNTFIRGQSPASDASPIYLTGCNGVVVSGNSATGFVGGPAIGGSNVSNVVISANEFTVNKDGISLWGTTTFVTMSGNVLAGNARYGINIKGQDITISGNDILNNSDTGINVTKDAINTERVTVSGCRIAGNRNYGVKVNTALVLLPVDARGNWWGHATGPYHASLNPGGLGDDVTDMVLFDPWYGAEHVISMVPSSSLTNCPTPVTYTFRIAQAGTPQGLRGYDVTFQINPAVVTIANVATDVLEGTYLDFFGDGSFYCVAKGGGVYTASGAILGPTAGASGPGDLFTVKLTAVAQGTSAIDVTTLKLRDPDNAPLSVAGIDGSIQIDCTLPTMEAIAELPGQCYKVAPVFSNFGFDDDLNLDLAEYNFDSGTWMTIFSGINAMFWDSDGWVLPGFAGLSEGAHTGYFRVKDDAGNWNGEGSPQPNLYSWSFVKDTMAPAALTNFVAVPGHDKVHLTWTNPTSDFVGVEIRRVAWGDYADYATAEPDYPADQSEGDLVIQTSLAAYDDSPRTPRDIYYYAAFTYDCAGNYSSASSTAQDRSTSYWLGDIDPDMTPGPSGDGLIGMGDLVAFSTVFGASDGGLGWNEEGDFGPTDDYSRFGIPDPDDVVDFEDLMIFAMNYGNVTAEGTSGALIALTGAVPLGEQVSFRLLPVSREDGKTTYAVVMENDSEILKGFSLKVAYGAGNALESATASRELSGKANEHFFGVIERESGVVEICVAALGVNAPFEYTGEVARVVVRESNEGAVQLKTVDLRDINNGRDEVTLPGGGGETPYIPVTTALLQNHPNPFNPTTTIAFDVAVAGEVRIEIYDVSGSLVRTLVNSEKPTGRHVATWDGRDGAGNQVHTGVYFYRMTAPGYTSQAKKMLLLK